MLIDFVCHQEHFDFRVQTLDLAVSLSSKLAAITKFLAPINLVLRNALQGLFSLMLNLGRFLSFLSQHSTLLIRFDLLVNFLLGAHFLTQLLARHLNHRLNDLSQPHFRLNIPDLSELLQDMLGWLCTSSDARQIFNH